MNLRLLIADSDAKRLARCRRFFARHGFDVDTAADGVECLAKLSTAAPDVLLLEWELLWGGGDGVLACLAETAGPSSLPVIVVSKDEQRPSQALCPPVVHHFQRPLRRRRVLGALRAAAAAPARVMKPAG